VKRAVVALLLLALWAEAEAEDLVVRVTVGDEPLPDAGVQVQPVRKAGPTFRADQFAPDARTDASGQALVQATRKDWILVYVPGYELAVVEGGGQIVDVALRPERIFSGRVVDSKGDPIVGASVVLRTTFHRQAAFPVATDERGNFHVYGLWFDNYSLSVEAAGFIDRMYAWLLTEQDSGETIILERPATLAGTVLGDRGEAVAGTELNVGPYLVKTSDDGTYRVSGLDPDRRHWVHFPRPWGGGAGPFALKEGEVREGVDVIRLAPVTLKLRVVDAEGRGLKGVSLRVAEVEGVRGIRVFGGPEVTSNAAGLIAARVRPEIRTELHLRADDRESATVRGPHSPSGTTQDLGEVVLRALPEIEVRVRQPDGTPPAEGTVGAVPLVDGIARVKGADMYDITVPGYPPMPWDVEPPGPVLSSFRATPVRQESRIGNDSRARK